MTKLVGLVGLSATCCTYLFSSLLTIQGQWLSFSQFSSLYFPQSVPACRRGCSNLSQVLSDFLRLQL